MRTPSPVFCCDPCEVSGDIGGVSSKCVLEWFSGPSDKENDLTDLGEPSGEDEFENGRSGGGSSFGSIPTPGDNEIMTFWAGFGGVLGFVGVPCPLGMAAGIGNNGSEITGVGVGVCTCLPVGGNGGTILFLDLSLCFLNSLDVVSDFDLLAIFSIEDDMGLGLEKDEGEGLGTILRVDK